MFRVRLASGEEAVYRTVDELALGIQSGVISDAAEYFEREVEAWRPLSAHPDYVAARDRAASMVATAESDELAPLPTVGELIRGGTVPVYQMFSQSARELEARRRPKWIMPTASAVAAVALLVGAGAYLLPAQDTSEEGVHTLSVTRSPRRAATETASATETPLEREVHLAPYNLANRLAQAGALLSASFTDSVQALNLGDLIALSRLRQPDSTAILRSGLQRFRTLRATYRARALELESAYQDSAATLARAGRWSQAELTEWRVRFTHLENAASAATTEAALVSLEELYQLFEAERGRVVITPNRVRFQRPDAALTYNRLRLSLENMAGLSPSAGERFPVPLALLQQGLRHSTLPPTP